GIQSVPFPVPYFHRCLVWLKSRVARTLDVEAAVKAAKNAFPIWSSKSPLERSQILNKLADLIEHDLEAFAQADVMLNIEMGGYGPNFYRLNSCLLWFCSVAGLISPWNLPLYLLTWKIAPAIACGNTVVAKPSEMTSVTAWMMCKLLEKAGVPHGVVNVVFGMGTKAGEALVCHPDVPLISFTGSTLTAQRITEKSAPHCKRLSLELGGKNPAIIFDDADLAQCIPTTLRSSFANQGEICLCTSRIFVQRGIYSEFLKRFVAEAKKWKVGNPSDPTVDKAQAEGARVLCGEGVDSLALPAGNRKGYFMLPTVIAEVKDESCCMQEEIFGPVTCVVAFDTEEEVIERANSVKYGLAATVWSSNVGRVHRVAKRLQSGLVWTNCWLVRDLNLPFGGMKASGVGREGAKDSYEVLVSHKLLHIPQKEK
uniref:Aldehyde dehydrogenase 8 family member A1 n=1 Tax=Bubo bubo TaxID=30461 RepID=A0A8C0FES4_BUBBB